ncbi:DUF1353 domain-containing protein [Ilyobacter sp.]|uniref:DUF1353 domain-containing protein n=1 Tax=Ilyobacter sp. TaxID=3100343 RepID=UPI003569B3E2
MEEIKLKKIGKNLWEVTEDFTHKDTTVTKTFKTDGASSPWWAKWLFPSVGEKYTTPSVLHDWWFKEKIGFRKANRRFYRAMRIWGVDKKTAKLFYRAVTLLGWTHYYFQGMIQ